VVAGLEIEGGGVAVRAQRDEVVLATCGDAVDDDVLDLRERFIGCRFRRGHRVLGPLDLLAELLRLGDEGGLLVLRRLRDALAVRVLRGAEFFERRDRGAAISIGHDGLIDRLGRLSPCLLRALHQLGIFAEYRQIDHPSSLVSAETRHPGPLVLVCTHAECPRRLTRSRPFG
jgi:hypothetical protein